MSVSRSRIAELAQNITQNTTLIESYLESHGLPYPTFEVDAPSDLKLTKELEDCKASILDATQELQELLLGPRMMLLSHHRMPFFPYGIISRFSIAQKVPINGEISYADLAIATGVGEAALTHILRYAIAFRVFSEKRPGYVSHSASSRMLLESPEFQDFLDMIREEIMTSSTRAADALERWPAADEPSQVPYLLAQGSDQPSFWHHLAQYPQREKRFTNSMKALSRQQDTTAQYPWDSFGSGTVVDVGGSAGETAFSLAEKYPNLKLIVQDLPQVVATAKRQDNLNITFMGYDFFETQPVKDADAYLYRRIFHDWPDKYCVRILKALIPALKPKARILIIDIVMTPFGILPNRVEREIRSMDIYMHICHNSNERDLEEWKNLLAAADSRFKLQEVRKAKDSFLSLLDIVWEP